MKDILLREDGRQVKFTAVQKSRPYVIISRETFLQKDTLKTVCLTSVIEDPDPVDPNLIGPLDPDPESYYYGTGFLFLKDKRLKEISENRFNVL